MMKLKKQSRLFSRCFLPKGIVLLLFSFLFSSGALFAQTGKERQLADQYLNNAEYDKAAELYDKLFDRDPFGTYPNYLRCLLSMKSFDKAEKLVRKISKKQPDNLSYGADLGFVYLSSGQEQKANDQFQRTIKLLRPDQGMILSLANAFTMRQDWDHALATYIEGKKLLREGYSFNFETAEVYYQKGDYTAMINEYLDAVEENTMVQQQVLNILQARVGYDPENNRGDLLRTSLLRRIQRSPDQPIFSEMLIWLFVQQKDFESD
jgi:tetratricopeptide (TPR) repeat protein